MRILFAAYCLIDDVNGNSLIGVYKRCLRLGLEMEKRGHEVWILCPERKSYQDELVLQAEARLHFLDLPSRIVYDVPVALRRAYCRLVLRRLKVDMVVAGEAPLAGLLVEASLWAVGAGVPLIILDNAYGPERARQFVEGHGPMADAVVLSGPSSFQMSSPPPFYCAAPPYIDGDEREAIRFLSRIDAARRPLITVLGYDRKAEELASGILPALAKRREFKKTALTAVFLSPDPEACQRRLIETDRINYSLTVLRPPGDNLLFGLLKLSGLVIGKCGFMQISECLSLGSPFMGVHYLGCAPLFLLPKQAASFVHPVDLRDWPSAQTLNATVENAVRLMQTSRRRIRSLHNGQFGAVRRIAEFLERLPLKPRRETIGESAAMGYSPALFEEALSARYASAAIEIRTIRACRLRDLDWGHLDLVACSYRAGEVSRTENLWGRVYQRDEDYRTELNAIANPKSNRSLFHASKHSRVLLEEAGEESLLPPLTL